ncbi:unnamed protein product [Arctogadus glacialis]
MFLMISIMAIKSIIGYISLQTNAAHRGDVFDLFPGTFQTPEMVVENPGTEHIYTLRAEVEQRVGVQHLSLQGYISLQTNAAHRGDVFDLFPGTFQTPEMVVENPGTEHIYTLRVDTGSNITIREVKTNQTVEDQLNLAVPRQAGGSAMKSGVLSD